jgi:DNA-3-methyladenine glycosylase I
VSPPKKPVAGAMQNYKKKETGLTNMKNTTRCLWSINDPIYITYHDEEWGVPVHDDRKLFEFIVLEGAQAGLSWLTILRKREGYRKAFAEFDPEKVARFTQAKIEKILLDPAIVRNKLKVNSAVTNAKAFLKVQEEFGSFDKYIWQFTDGKPIVNHWKSLKEIPAKTKESDIMSKDLISRGFKFVGSTICYAHMQATGMVNDHTVDCFRHKGVQS